MIPALLWHAQAAVSEVSVLENVAKAELAVYSLKDDGGRWMDCLKVAEVEPGQYLGAYHSLSDGSFKLNLAKSTDLKTWKQHVQLDEHAHQPTIQRWAHGWLMAWEKDGSSGNWIRVANFRTLDDLLANKPERVKDLSRSLSNFAEGTPSFRALSGAALDSSRIDLGFHYYRNGDVDRQALGTLTGFDKWTTNVDEKTNRDLDAYKGNIGDRDYFKSRGRAFTLLECQDVKNDWASWNIVLIGEDAKYTRLKMRTRGGSRSFANPTATQLSDGRTVITMYLHGAGAAQGELGCLLYTVRFPGS